MANTAKQVKSSAGETLSAANNGFATDIYQALLTKGSSANLIISPYSLHSVLGMVAQGARGETKTQLIKGLKFEEGVTDKAIQSGYNFIIADLNEEEEDNRKDFLRTANRVFSKTGFTLNKSFIKVMQSDFLAEFEQLDFSTDAKRAEAADRINSWVATKTKDKITDLLSPDSLEPLTSLVLVNCIYFKGTWSEQFEPEYTCKDDFYLTPTKKVEVDMMRNTHQFAYGELPELDAHVVDLAYRGGKMSMRIILPNAVDGLARIQAGLGTLRQNGQNLVLEAMDKFRKENAYYYVHLELPKFKIEATIGNLQEVLSNDLGMNSMFCEKTADFGGIPAGVNWPPLYVSEVIQKAYISVTEQGTEAAAATSIGLVCGSTNREEPKYFDFCVDRPFYFEIVDDENNDLVLFSGHVMDPSSK